MSCPLQLHSKHEVLLPGGIFTTACESLFAQETENDAGTEASHVESADAALEAPFLPVAILPINPPPPIRIGYKPSLSACHYKQLSRGHLPSPFLLTGKTVQRNS